MIDKQIQELEERRTELQKAIEAGGKLEAMQNALEEYNRLTNDIVSLREGQFMGEVAHIHHSFMSDDGIRSRELSRYLRHLAYKIAKHIAPMLSDEEVCVKLDSLELRRKLSPGERPRNAQ